MNSTQSFLLSEEMVHLLFNSTLYKSELVMCQKSEGYEGKHTIHLGHALCDV